MGENAQYTVIVSGLPRSGTSMMMRMLDKGGVPAFIDKLRVADDDNPNGYYEFERVKALPEDNEWVPDTIGHAVKVIYKLVYELPADIHYKVVFMAREIREVMASQNKMLSRSGIEVSDENTALFAAMFKKDLAEFKDWVAKQPNIDILYVDYGQVLKDTPSAAKLIGDFLGKELDVDAMAGVVMPELYRNRVEVK